MVPGVVIFSLWDVAAIAHQHWSYNPRYVTGWELPGQLPIEEVAFFAVIPICALLTFGVVSRCPRPRSALTVYTVWAVVAAVAVVAIEVGWLRTGLFRSGAYWVTLAITWAFQIPVDGWLTKLSAPIVRYNPKEMLGHPVPVGHPGRGLRLRVRPRHVGVDVVVAQRGS